jgi:hypothetical protein
MIIKGQRDEQTSQRIVELVHSKINRMERIAAKQGPQNLQSLIRPPNKGNFSIHDLGQHRLQQKTEIVKVIIMMLTEAITGMTLQVNNWKNGSGRYCVPGDAWWFEDKKKIKVIDLVTLSPETRARIAKQTLQARDPADGERTPKHNVLIAWRNMLDTGKSMSSVRIYNKATQAYEVADFTYVCAVCCGSTVMKCKQCEFAICLDCFLNGRNAGMTTAETPYVELYACLCAKTVRVTLSWTEKMRSEFKERGEKV